MDKKESSSGFKNENAPCQEIANAYRYKNIHETKYKETFEKVKDLIQLVKQGRDLESELEKEKKQIIGLWPEGKIYYKIGAFESCGLLDLVKEAIIEWNAINSPHCEFISIEDQQSMYFVTFFQRFEDFPQAHIGCCFNDTQFIKIPEKYPGGSDVKVPCILHEMMHCAGFVHEHCRDDRDNYCLVSSKDDDFVVTGEKIGQYDFFSLLHYEEMKGLEFKNEDLRKLANKSVTFSAGDRAAIKLVYAPKGTHHGEWHKPCEPDRCTKEVCACNNCGLIKGGVNCGYSGQKGHWTCCMDEDFTSKCSTTHTGFWHAQCEKECTKTECGCENCGGGCSYEGSKAHWNCCNQEKLKSDGENKFKKVSS